MFHRYLRYAPDISWLASRSQSLLRQAQCGDTRPGTEFILGFAAAGYADPAKAFPRMQDRQTAAQHRQPRMAGQTRSEEHTSELQSRPHLVCRLLLEKKKNTQTTQ